MKPIITTSVVALALAFAGASLAIPGPGWGPGCAYYDSADVDTGNHYRGYGARRGYGPQQGLQRGMRSYGMRGRGFQSMLSNLDLSEEQRTALQDIHQGYRQRMIEHRDRMRENRGRIQALNSQFPVDPAKIEELAERQGDLVSERIALRAEKHARIQQLLTAEQRDQWQQNMQRRPRRWAWND